MCVRDVQTWNSILHRKMENAAVDIEIAQYLLCVLFASSSAREVGLQTRDSICLQHKLAIRFACNTNSRFDLFMRFDLPASLSMWGAIALLSQVPALPPRLHVAR